MISKQEALKMIRNTSKYSHSLMVSAIMRRLAERLGENAEEWEIVGLLHDLDYDQTRNDMSKHGIVASEILKGKLPETCLYAIKCHDYRTGFKPKSKLDNALIVADTLAVIIEYIKRSGKEKLKPEEVKEKILKISENKPWLKDNLQRIKRLGLAEAEAVRLLMEFV
ncbi:HDIG domain-containing protein [Candidatus Bathyarchaeota archaeon]|nr:HDIG domain-containing protein [Candidatus Bathyarchaeota archaeon]